MKIHVIHHIPLHEQKVGCTVCCKH